MCVCVCVCVFNMYTTFMDFYYSLTKSSVINLK